MAENSTKRSFPADIFAEDNDKWSWSAPSVNTKTGVPNYSALRKVTQDEGSSSSGSENEFRSDSNSGKRIFRKRSSSNSEGGNPLEDASSSPSMPSRERLLPPSMYDDDARSASPSAYEKKDLAFAALFQKEFHPVASSDGSSPPREVGKDRQREKEMVRKYNRGLSPEESSPKRGSKTETSRRRSRSRSKGRRRTKSPVKRRSKSRERHSERDRRRHSKSRGRRSHSRDSRSRRSPSRDSRSRRSPSRDSRSRRSPSRDSRSRRSHSRDSRRRSRSRDRKRSRSRGYRRSRSRSHDKVHRSSRRRSSSRDRYRRKAYSRSPSQSRDRSKGRSGGGSSGNRVPLPPPGGVTPQMALQQTMAAMSAKAQALTGIALPKYYNPAAVNPLKYAEQVQKRKLLWQPADKVEEQGKSSVWDKLTFAQDQDGKMTAKFRKLMGIKSEQQPAPEVEEKESVLKKQEELFRDLDQQYEMARMTTHTQRGVGLGYSAPTALYPPMPK